MPPTESAPAFRRTLSLTALLFFGIAFVGPTAPYTFFGLGSEKSQGHLALVYVIATVAMMFTAISYGRMSRAHPRAGSVYSYASAELHPLAGYFAGWAMVLDYVFLPIISVIIIGTTLNKLVPAVPYAIWAIGSAVVTTLLNLRGIVVTTRFTIIYTALLAVSVVWFCALAIPALLRGVGQGELLSLTPFYNPATFNLSAIQSAFALAVLSFLGFDGTSTLAEDAKNPSRDVPRATVLTCLVCGASFVALTYLGQLLWPVWTKFQSHETAFSEIGGLVSGSVLFAVISGFVLGQAATAIVTSQASASRLLYGMSREGRLPHAVFGYIHPRLETPLYSVLLIGLMSATAPMLLSLDQAAEMVNFGACIGFIGVNLSALVRASREWRRGERGALWMAAPLLGFVICAWIWWSLSGLAMKLGAVWVLLGFCHLAVLTRGKFKLALA
ncbi:MAG: APC family permease [Opitutaceae bacterium]